MGFKVVDRLGHWTLGLGAENSGWLLFELGACTRGM